MKFFYPEAFHRHQKNLFIKLKDKDGVWWENSDLHTFIVEHFKDLYSIGSPKGMTDFLGPLTGWIIEEISTDLQKPYSHKEVYTTLQQMSPSKALGPDSMSPLYYYKYWHITGKALSNATLNALNFGVFPFKLNKTYITLIPKKQKPKSVSDYRPINLCNVLYKLIAKIVDNRLKKWMHAIISPSQSAFMLGRLITNNILVAHKLIHFLN